MMYILLVGLNHKTAPVEVREQLAFDSAASVEALKEFKHRYPNAEFVILSTCNRVELYIAMEKKAQVPPTEIAVCLARMRGVDFDVFRRHIYIMKDQHAVRHLLTVTSSLDSMIIGENQISAQVRESYALACDAASTGKVLNHLFHTAFAASKKVFAQTSISSRRVSVAGVAVELAKQLFDDIKSARIVVLGAGEMGELLVEHFIHIKCHDITVVNRTRQRACTVASRHGVKAADWDAIEKELTEANIVIGAASANDGYLFDKNYFSRIMSKRRSKTLLAIDITVPRSFDPNINKLEGVYLYCIDDLSQVVENNIKLREGDLEKAVEIICRSVSDFMAWFARKDIGPLIGKMKNAFGKIQKYEMEKFFSGNRRQACCKDVMDVTVNRVVNKLLHCVIRNIELIAYQKSPTDAVKLAESILEHAEDIIDDNRKVTSNGLKVKTNNTEKNRILRLLFWESTIKCNLTCVHCRRIETDEAAPADMATDQAMDMIDQLAELGRDQGFMPVLIFSGGEPLCRDDIFDLINHARKRGLQLALASNGTLIDHKVAEKIKNSGIQRVSISLDGATSEVHNKLRQMESSFEDAVKGIGHLKNSGVSFQINVTITRHNAHQLDEVFVLAKNLGAVAVHLFMLVPVGCGEEFAQEDMLSADEYEKMMERIARLEVSQDLQIKVTCGPHYERVVRQAGLRKEPQQPDMPACPHGHGKGGHPAEKPVHASKGCLAGVSVIFVGHQGDVFPCGYLPVNCGNIMETPLADIWHNSQDLANMRDTSRLGGKCGICEYKNICGGCRARAYSVAGDYMAEEPFCGYVPHAKK